MTHLIELFFNFVLKLKSVNEFFRNQKNHGAVLQSIFFSMQLLFIVMRTAGKKCIGWS